MTTFLLSFFFFLLVVAGMAVGVIFSNKPIQGSCGGMGALGIDTACDICGGNPTVCEQETRQHGSVQAGGPGSDTAGVELFYEADTHK